MSGLKRSRAYLGLGGNIGDPKATMAAALQLLDADPDIAVETVSSLYSTPPWGLTDQPDFLNAAAMIITTLAPRDALARCLAAETSLHRVRDVRWGPRSVDLDVLTYDDLEIREPGLELPHPRMMDRAFVLVPLVEIAPDLSVGGEAISERLNELDTSDITKIEGPEWWRA